ncbi:flagellar hook-associated protein FlgK [Labrenzia sp. R4_2]|uniref:flagellar hook-associated protein FlgK n=1 Tax=Labrenzia sp. R4_2 TaxID=2821107 RepID=UPI001AD9EF5E|nr:flagellar hook-associated protein FlgK [Labrenzia sp. R4_2]MBO9419907.1 flagellar hook-associated protein FlgK [Labrenzia sp. R4_2]
MGLTSALNTAVFGISFNQRQIDVTASNIANADTAGYSKKTVSANAYFDGEGNVAGIVTNEISRIINEEIQSDYFNSLADTNYGKQIAAFTDRLDDIFGTIGDQTGLSALAGELTAALSSLVNQPGNYAAQQEVVAAADAMARELNSSYQQIADLRQEADEALARQTETVNSLLSSIESIDAAIRDATQAGVSSSEMEDERDRLVEQLSGYLDLNVSKTTTNTLFIQTKNGQPLFSDGEAATLAFQPTNRLGADQQGNAIVATTAGGAQFDIVPAGASGRDRTTGTGLMVATMELRDDVLIEAQKQLDTIAAELSLAFSNVTQASTAATVGPDTGFDLPVSGLQSGNTINLEYTDSAGQSQTIMLMAVSDPTLLPLADTATTNPNDTVVGIDISSGTPATYITNIIAALGTAAPDLQVSNDGSDNLRILGDSTTVPNATTVESLSANITPSATTDQGLGLSIFVDQRNGTEVFTDAPENGGQRVGYANGISVNPALLADSSLLVDYQTTPAANSENDPARAQYLLNALTNETAYFDPEAGMGSSSSPFQGTVLDYINQTVAYQGNQAADAKTYSDSKEALTLNLAVRYEESYSVNLDAEMAFLVQLENAYAANARVMQTINDLMQELLNVVR